MGAVVKNPLAQIALPSLPRATPVVFIDDSLARFPTIPSKEIRSLSRFVPVLVLIDKSTIKKLAVREISESKPLTQTSESTKLPGLFGQAVNHFKTSNTDSVIVFGDVVVDLSPHEARGGGKRFGYTPPNLQPV